MVRLARRVRGTAQDWAVSVLVRKHGLAGLSHIRLAGRDGPQGIVGQQIENISSSALYALSGQRLALRDRHFRDDAHDLCVALCTTAQRRQILSGKGVVRLSHDGIGRFRALWVRLFRPETLGRQRSGWPPCPLPCLEFFLAPLPRAWMPWV